MHEFVKPGFAVWPWASHFPSLGLSSLICKTEIKQTSQGCCEDTVRKKNHGSDFWVTIYQALTLAGPMLRTSQTFTPPKAF